MTFWDWLYAIGGILLSTGAGAAVVYGLSNWLGKVWADRMLESDRSKYATELEALKNNYVRDLQVLRDGQERGQFVHRLQFETEFKAYVDLWPLAHAVNIAAQRLRYPIEFEKVDDEVKRGNLARAFDAYRDGFELRKPFLLPDVYDAAKRLDDAIFNELWDWNRGYDGRRHLEYWDAADANRKKIIAMTDAICAAIRDRIGIAAPRTDSTATLSDGPPAKSDI